MKPILIAGVLFLGRIAAADVQGVEVNKQNQEERAGDRFVVKATARNDMVEFYVVVKDRPNEKLVAVHLLILDETKFVAKAPLAPARSRPAQGHAVTFQVAPRFANGSYLQVGIDHGPTVGANYRIDLGSYLD